MLKNILLGIICMLCIATMPGCKKSCNYNCLRGGYCVGSVCSCPDPYSGTSCDTLCQLGLEGYMCLTPSRNKFLGTWSCTSTDQAANAKTYLISFSEDSNHVVMHMNNFNNIGGYPIICTMMGKTTFDVSEPLQGTSGPFVGISGDGKLDNGKLTIYMSTPSNNYFVTATKQ